LSAVCIVCSLYCLQFVLSVTSIFWPFLSVSFYYGEMEELTGKTTSGDIFWEKLIGDI